jgi:hypothetical protein
MGYYWNFLAEQLTLCNLYKEDFNMTKLSKKVMSLVVASSVAITSIFAGDMLGSNSAKAAETTTKTITIHFKPGYNTTKDDDKLSYVQLKTKQDDINNRDKNENNFTEFDEEKASWYKASVEITTEASKQFRFKVQKANPSSTDTAKGVRYFPPLKDESASDIEKKYKYLDAITLDDNTTDYYFLGNTSDKSVTANANAKAQYDTDMNNSTATQTPTATANTTSTPVPNKTAGKVLVRYTAPDAWKNYSYVFIHYNTGETKTDGTLQWYYKPMQKINNTWFYTVNLGSADKATIQFLAYTGSSKDISTSKLNNDNTNSDYIKNLKDASKATWETNNNTACEYTVKAGTVDIVGQSHKLTQTYTANGTVSGATATPKPTATPYIVPTAKVISTVAPIAGMPYVDSEMGSNATFADDANNDGLTMILSLKNGATRATYTVDDGPVFEITKTTSVTIGQGKIVGEPIVMKITSTDGTRTSTQTFTYTKVANYSITNMTRISRTNATPVPTVAPNGPYTIEFKKPSSWNLSSNQKVYLYSYCNDATTDTLPTEPNGKWPGSIMSVTNSTDGTWYTGTIKNADANTRYIISYGSVSGTTNVANTVAQFPAQDVEGFLVRDGLKVIEGNQQTVGDNADATALTAYFGATASSPQKQGSSWTLKTVCQNAVGNVTYSYYIDNCGSLSTSPNGSAVLEASSYISRFPDGRIPVTATVSDDKYTITMHKYFTVSNDKAIAIPTPVATSTATPTASPIVTPSANAATATPIATTSPVVTATPIVMPTIDPNPAVNPTLTVDGTISFSSATQSVGKAVNINVALTNQKANATYSFTYFVDDEPIASTTTATTAKWVADEVGQHIVKVIVLENGVSVATLQKSYKVTSSTVKFTSVKTNKKSGVKANTSIKITAKAKSSVGSVTYRFEITKGKSTTVLKNYSSKSSVVWKPKKKGTYKIVVYAKNKYKKVVKKTITFKVK